MIRVLGRLAGIFLLAYAAVHLGYARLEQELLHRSCCGLAELPIPEPGRPGGTEKTKKAEKTSQAISADSPTGFPETASQPSSTGGKPDLKDQSPAPGGPESNAPATTPLPEDARTVASEKPDVQVIIQRNIFQLIQQEEPPKETEQQPAVARKTAPEAVPTSLNLTLQGTVLGDEHTSRAVIIEAKKNEQKLYHIGDAVQGAIIESIERGKVILDVFGARETLMMNKREGGGPALPSLPARITPPEPQQPPDLMEDEIEEDDVEEQQVRRTRRPPAIRPHRRVNFRRNPMRTRPDTDAEENAGEEEPIDLEEELPFPN